MDKSIEFILASASPRRIELLKRILTEFTVCPADVCENVPAGTRPVDAAAYLAEIKAKAIFNTGSESRAIIGADTVVDADGVILGKPANAAEAAAMLSLISGRRHKVHTGVAIITGGALRVFSETTEVFVNNMTKREIDEYASSGEAFDKAGGYGIQGEFCKYISRIDGCYYNVMGLPVARLYNELKNMRLI